MLRRAGQTASPAPREVGNLHLSTSRREVRIGESEPIALTVLEGRLLDCLIINSGQILTFDALIDHVWGAQGGDRDMLRQLVRRLRRKIEIDPANPTYIQTVPGLGYGFIAER